MQRRFGGRLLAGLASSSTAPTWQWRHCTTSSSSSQVAEVLKRPEIATQLNDWNLSFAEARELIQEALDSVGTTYFSEDIDDAAEQTADAADRWAALKKQLTESGETAAVQRLEREYEVKMKQLQQELEAAQHAGGD